MQFICGICSILRECFLPRSNERLQRCRGLGSNRPPTVGAQGRSNGRTNIIGFSEAVAPTLPTSGSSTGLLRACSLFRASRQSVLRSSRTHLALPRAYPCLAFSTHGSSFNRQGHHTHFHIKTAVEITESRARGDNVRISSVAIQLQVISNIIMAAYVEDVRELIAVEMRDVRAALPFENDV